MLPWSSAMIIPLITHLCKLQTAHFNILCSTNLFSRFSISLSQLLLLFLADMPSQYSALVCTCATYAVIRTVKVLWIIYTCSHWVWLWKKVKGRMENHRLSWILILSEIKSLAKLFIKNCRIHWFSRLLFMFVCLFVFCNLSSRWSWRSTGGQR